VVFLAVDSDPDYSLGYLALAKFYFMSSFLKDNKEELIAQSFKNLDKALSINPNQSLVHMQLAIQYKVLGEKSKFNLVIKKLPKIIENDITLGADEKKELENIINNN
jgi:Tfp pilus assembly protein PilF